MVLVPGCGNSDLSQKICANLGISKLVIESVDYEDQIVKKMEDEKPKDLRLSFKVGDCTDLSDLYKEGSLFNFAVDKGMLDAIAVDAVEETVKKCNAYFNEMVRVLDDKNGMFMIVSLLQPHVLKIVLDFFLLENDVNKYQKQNLFQIKIQQIEHIEGYAEKQFIKYFISVKKNAVDVKNPKMV
jgi:ubiquinone/menaquinone biosynthesis C-methylase UbiE